MPSNLSEALNTSRPRKMMKEAACATNFIKGLRRTFPSCHKAKKKKKRKENFYFGESGFRIWRLLYRIEKKKWNENILKILLLFLKSYSLWKLLLLRDASSKNNLRSLQISLFINIQSVFINRCTSGNHKAYTGYSYF